MIFLFIGLLASLAVTALEIYLHYREKEEIFNRYMAGDYQSYRYYKDQFKTEIALQEKEAEATIEKKITPEDARTKFEARKF
jgi:hypothetical protein